MICKGLGLRRNAAASQPKTIAQTTFPKRIDFFYKIATDWALLGQIQLDTISNFPSTFLASQPANRIAFGLLYDTIGLLVGLLVGLPFACVCGHMKLGCKLALVSCAYMYAHAYAASPAIAN